MARYDRVRKQNVFTPFRRFLIALTVVAFFHSWEPPQNATSDPATPETVKTIKAEFPALEYVKTRIYPWDSDPILPPVNTDLIVNHQHDMDLDLNYSSNVFPVWIQPVISF